MKQEAWSLYFPCWTPTKPFFSLAILNHMVYFHLPRPFCWLQIIKLLCIYIDVIVSKFWCVFHRMCENQYENTIIQVLMTAHDDQRRWIFFHGTQLLSYKLKKTKINSLIYFSNKQRFLWSKNQNTSWKISSGKWKQQLMSAFWCPLLSIAWQKVIIFFMLRTLHVYKEWILIGHKIDLYL